MPIFRRENEGVAAPGAAVSREPPPRGETRGKATLIAAGTRITGQITGATEVHIDGEVDGDIRVDDTVVVGAQGKVKGQISARIVRVGGKVAGNLTGRDRVEVLPSGSTEGDISAPRVVVAEGAFVKGKVEMNAGAERGAK
jgi:cytoskeletal protein CcmA (bactofilin family)